MQPHDRSRATELHFEVVDEFLRAVWDAGGRSRADVIAYISPTRTDVAEDLRRPNADLVAPTEWVRCRTRRDTKVRLDRERSGLTIARPNARRALFVFLILLVC
jgi:hypothetical protein